MVSSKFPDSVQSLTNFQRPQGRVCDVLLANCLGVLAGACTQLVGLSIDGAAAADGAASALTARTMPSIGMLTSLRSLQILNVEGIQSCQVCTLVFVSAHSLRSCVLTQGRV